MKYLLVLFGLLLFAHLDCADWGVPAPVAPRDPAWVQRLIVSFEQAPVGNPPQSIWRYRYNGRRVYYVPPQCCDQFSTLYDSTGVILCAPDGGLTGSGNGRCPDFFKLREDEVLVWKDPRTR
jgi:hypothetical protein